MGGRILGFGGERVNPKPSPPAPLAPPLKNPNPRTPPPAPPPLPPPGQDCGSGGAGSANLQRRRAGPPAGAPTHHTRGQGPGLGYVARGQGPGSRPPCRYASTHQALGARGQGSGCSPCRYAITHQGPGFRVQGGLGRVFAEVLLDTEISRELTRLVEVLLHRCAYAWPAHSSGGPGESAHQRVLPSLSLCPSGAPCQRWMGFRFWGYSLYRTARGSQGCVPGCARCGSKTIYCPGCGS